jgi:hypothetical protein
MIQQLQNLIHQEDGVAMTSNASFLGGCALIFGVAYYYFGARAYGFVNMVMSSPPPGTSSTLFQ